jgi:hypothetical protein|tara:strand:- start:1844 stop:2191 length:348 start_codon:yes stop_codon:yes gene_type:complete
MAETIKLNVESWTIAQKERSRGRMKFQIKLNKVETESFKAFTETVKPEEVTQDDFVKSIFLTGIEAMNQKIMNMVEEYAKANPEDFKAQLVEMEDMAASGEPEEKSKGSKIEIVD